LKRGRDKTQTFSTPAVIPTEEESGQEQVTINGLGGPLLRWNDTRFGRIAKLLGKYGSTSVVATSADFGMFHIALTYLGSSPVWATVLGRAVGSVVAFLLHSSWVFRNSQNRKGNVLLLKYVAGIFIGMALNAAGVWFLNSVLTLAPWPARIVTATVVWFFGFLFNKKIVFG